MIKLYSTNCPRCNVLEKKLGQAEIDFEKITEFDLNEMVSKGFETAPILEVDGELFDYTTAVKKINEWR